MTTTTTTTTTAAALDAESMLRKVLVVNTMFSVVTGIVGLVVGGPVADALGVGQTWLIRPLCVGLLGFAGIVYLVARSSQPVLERWSREIIVADLGWVLGTVVVIALGWLSASGTVIMAIIAGAVLALGLAQRHFRNAMRARSVR